ncbi:MAG TPA: MFS transporter [Devosia sp.]|nr:MFS transporter [Devosia sp.]
MPTDRLAALLARRGIHYGWIVAGTTFLVMLATAAAMGSAGVLMQPLQQEFGWTTEQVSSAFAVRLVFFGLLGPFAAAFMNHFGIRKVVTAALVLIGAGVAASLFMTQLWQLMVLWGIVIGVGTGMTALVLGATVASRWFDKRRGLVVGMMTASNATGQLIFLPLLAALAQNIGWRAALTFVLVILAVAFVLAAIFLRDHPADMGLPVYGRTTITPVPPRSRRLVELLTTPLLTLREAARTQVFWVLFATFFVCGFSTNGLIQQHWISICGDVGITPTGAAGYLALIGAFDFVGTILSGWLSDRYDNRYLLLAYYGFRGLSLLYLPFSGFSLWTLTAFAVFYGLDWVATVPPTVKLTAQRFGAEKAGLVFGWVFAGHQLGAASAAFLAGAVRTGTSSYMPAIFLAGFFCLLAALLILTISKPVRVAPATAAATA